MLRKVLTTNTDTSIQCTCKTGRTCTCTGICCLYVVFLASWMCCMSVSGDINYFDTQLTEQWRDLRTNLRGKKKSNTENCLSQVRQQSSRKSNGQHTICNSCMYKKNLIYIYKVQLGICLPVLCLELHTSHLIFLGTNTCINKDFKHPQKH